MSIVGFTGAVLLATLAAMAAAQQKPQAASQRNLYDLSREVSLQGTVVSFAESAKTPPLGPHVVMQTASGQIDVHLGDARLLQASHLVLATGDSIGVLGENVSYGEGTQFFARIVQKGSQTVELRSNRGYPLRPAGKSGKTQAGVL